MATPRSPERSSPANTWKDRRHTSLALRLLARVGPLLASVTVSYLLIQWLPQPSTVMGTLLWWLGVVGSSVVTMVALDALLRRLLPLAALLRMTMVFPDHAPSRFAAARHVGRPKELEQRLAQLAAAHLSDSVEARQDSAILGLVAALTVHDKRTRGHSERVRIFADMIAEEMGISDMERAKLRWAMMLHDIGKIRVDPAILNKPGPLSDEERDVVRLHPAGGAELTAPLLAWLAPWGAAVAEHHERYDGTGYPAGLEGDQITLAGRIAGVADAFETMTAARAYKRPRPPAEARRELVKCSGTHFDPAVVRAFLSISLGRLYRAIGPVAVVASVPVLAAAMARVPRINPSAASSGVAALTVTAVMAIASPQHALGVSQNHSPSRVAAITPHSISPTVLPPPAESPSPSIPPRNLDRQQALPPSTSTASSAGGGPSSPTPPAASGPQPLVQVSASVSGTTPETGTPVSVERTIDIYASPASLSTK